MPRASLNDILNHALQNGYAVGYFEAWDQHSLEAVLEAAQETDSPAILGFGANSMIDQGWLDRGGIEALAGLACCLAERSTVPTAVLLNEATSFAQVIRGLRAGCDAVMLDSSHLPYEEHVAVARKVVEVAHALGAAVEEELGHLADAFGAAGTARPTDPDEAARFVARTGVDALAVAVGNVHLLSEGEPVIDLDRLAEIHQAVSVPLVIHGGTGFPDQAVPAAIERGVAKFNVGTALRRAYLTAIQAASASVPEGVNYHDVVGSHRESDVLVRAKDGVKAEIVRRIQLYGSAGMARAW